MPTTERTPEQRVETCKAEVEAVLQKYRCALSIQDPQVYPAGPGQLLVRTGAAQIIALPDATAPA